MKKKTGYPEKLFCIRRWNQIVTEQIDCACGAQRNGVEENKSAGSNAALKMKAFSSVRNELNFEYYEAADFEELKSQALRH